jgi:hypothetical protein
VVLLPIINSPHLRCLPLLPCLMRMASFKKTLFLSGFALAVQFELTDMPVVNLI